ncbi:MAG: methyltransferase domain-containing protein [Planctomycetota bacterium]|jgi:SAM-dependent methyltransferase
MEHADELRRAVREKYRSVSIQPRGPFPYPVGRESAVGLGYESAWLEAVPADVIERFVGVGNPFRVRRPERGARILDLGCGSGLDVFVAAVLVGAAGRAVGLDLTPEMLAWPRRHVTGWTLGNVEFEEGMIEALPFESGSFDMVISNGALNLVPRKDAAFREIFRVLAPGGAFAVADLLVTSTVPEEVLAGMDAWST